MTSSCKYTPLLSSPQSWVKWPELWWLQSKARDVRGGRYRQGCHGDKGGGWSAHLPQCCNRTLQVYQNINKTSGRKNGRQKTEKESKEAMTAYEKFGDWRKNFNRTEKSVFSLGKQRRDMQRSFVKYGLNFDVIGRLLQTGAEPESLERLFLLSILRENLKLCCNWNVRSIKQRLRWQAHCSRDVLTEMFSLCWTEMVPARLQLHQPKLYRKLFTKNMCVFSGRLHFQSCSCFCSGNLLLNFLCWESPKCTWRSRSWLDQQTPAPLGPAAAEQMVSDGLRRTKLMHKYVH